METAFYVIAILGCGEAEAPCQQVQLLQPRYETQAECTSATAAALEANADAAYPVVVAQCVAGKAGARAQLLGSEVSLPEPGQPARNRHASAKALRS